MPGQSGTYRLAAKPAQMTYHTRWDEGLANLPVTVKSSTHRIAHQIPRFGSPAVRSLDMPTSFFSIELSACNDTLESCLALDIENTVTSIEVVSQVVIIWVVVWPIVSCICQFRVKRI